MSNSPLGCSFLSKDRAQTWLSRVCENLCVALHGMKLHPASSNGAPLHFQAIETSERNRAAQAVSAGAHIAILIALLFLIASSPNHGPFRPPNPLGPGKMLLPYIPLPRPESTGHASLSTDGSGGGRDTRPTRWGELAPRSSMPLVPPRLTHNDQPVLPAPPAVLDPDAPANSPVVTYLGFPWMKSNTDSAGRGRGHGFGDSDGDGMGDGNGNGVGDGGDGSPYANVASTVACIYCSEPGYTEEARKAKLQGKLLLQVLVGDDGRAQRVRVLQGLGMGLDENAIETVRSWRFSPARDANKRPVPAWVTIETRFHLY